MKKALACVMRSGSEASGLTNRAAWPTQMLRCRSAWHVKGCLSWYAVKRPSRMSCWAAAKHLRPHCSG